MTQDPKDDALVLWTNSRGHDGRPVSLKEFAYREVEAWRTDEDGDPVPLRERAKAAILTVSAAERPRQARVAVTLRDGQPVARILEDGEPLGEALMRLKGEIQ